jgi:P27 family predicted phage terminase small subunit
MGRTRKPLEERVNEARGSGYAANGKKIDKAATTTLVLAEPNSTIPEPPIGLKGRGTIEWVQIWSKVPWLHPDQDYHLVEQIVRNYDDMSEFRQQIQRDGLMVKGYAGQLTANPLIKEIRTCEATIRKCLSMLGVSPTDRVKLGLNEMKRQDKLSDLRKKTQDHTGSA